MISYNTNMNGLNVEHELFHLIRNEHKTILAQLATIESSTDLKQLSQWLWQHNELKHHQKEEKILFNFLLTNPMVNGGGPLCMIYMDNYIMNSPLDRAKQLTGRMPKIEAHTQRIFDEASAMRIPVNEHRAGKEILCFILQQQETLAETKVRQLLNEYRKIQIEHINKEENCFFYMCASLLQPKQADELLRLWQE